MTLEGFSQETSEKIERLCDLLESIEKSEFVSKRLSLYGGTALNFVYLDRPRLSEDLDFNYRHIDQEDWGEVRDKIDENLKYILRSLGYEDENVKIDPKHNMCRFHIGYTTESGLNDNIKIEIGYMRRRPNLKNDTRTSFSHLTKGKSIEVMVPEKEELYANKFATMISRSRTYLNPRDIFDVYSISTEKFHYRLFLELVALEAILMDMTYYSLCQVKQRFKHGKVSGRIEHLIKDELHIEELFSKVIPFSEDVVDEISVYELDTAIDHFHETGELNLERFEFRKRFHPKLSKHPQLLWLRMQ